MIQTIIKPMLTFEDFKIGDKLPLGPYPVSREAIIEFAEEFDPQPFHLSEEGGKDTPAGGLIASGWHTCSMLMRMMCDSFLDNSTSQGAPGVDEVRWLSPVKPGDVLSGTSEVLSKRVSKSRPEVGIFFMRHEVFNQHGTLVMWVENTGMMGLRDPQSEEGTL